MEQVFSDSSEEHERWNKERIENENKYIRQYKIK